MSRTEETAAWREFVAANAEGGVLQGTVARVLPFGAFVEVAQGIQGLLVTDRGAAPEHGATLPVRIKEIDVEKRRFSLVMA